MLKDLTILPMRHLNDPIFTLSRQMLMSPEWEFVTVDGITYSIFSSNHEDDSESYAVKLSDLEVSQQTNGLIRYYLETWIREDGMPTYAMQHGFVLAI